MTSDTSPMPLVTVALCTYNGAPYLRAQLDSILAQRDVALEVIALDDGSSDDSVAILQEYAARDPRVQVHCNERNLGHLRSFEKAMAMGRGTLIAPSDQDDLWHPDKLRLLVDALGDADLVYCDSEYVDADLLPINGNVSDFFTMFSGRDPTLLLFQNTVSGHACLFPRELLAVAGPAPEGLYHDWWLAMCAAGRNGVAYLDAPLVKFRRHVDAATTLGTARENCKPPSNNRRWIAERIFLGRAYARSGLRGSDFAAAFADAMVKGRDGSLLPIARILWRHRAQLPPATKPGWVKAIKLLSRVRRKSARARREPPLEIEAGKLL